MFGCPVSAWTDQTAGRNYIMKADQSEMVIFQALNQSEVMRCGDVDVVIRQVHAIVLMQTAGS